jgi:hypothetical protein
LIDKAKQVIASGLVEAATQQQQQDGTGSQQQQRTLTNSELNEARVPTLPNGNIWLQRLIHSTCFHCWNRGLVSTPKI